MNGFNTIAYTPATINTIKFRIPLYQRPYAWENLQIELLLNDLYSQFKKDINQKYFIGILNVGNTENKDLFDLIDGQQRITTLNLIGKVLSDYHYLWNTFLNNRLDLYGRKEDQLYLVKGDISLNPNPKMVEAIVVIQKFVKSQVDEKQKFAKYVFENAAFFISKVPDHYTLIEKNLQFVRMNNRGKQLETHDILKIKLASIITIADKRNNFIKQWNDISQLGCGSDSSNLSENKSLKEILETQEIFKDAGKENEIFYQSIVTFNEFLLIALDRFFKKEYPHLIVSHQKDKKDIDYRKDRLMEEFGFGEKVIYEFRWTEGNSLKFIDLLQKQFELFNNFIIKRDKEEKYKFNGDKERFLGSALIELQVFQSFLYVTREPYQNNWLIDTFEYLEKSNFTVNINTNIFLTYLKRLDNDKALSRNHSSFNYYNIDRYWFWRLDYYLWEKRDQYFSGKSLEIANKYVFRVNRSIEHVAPQTPKSESKINVEPVLLNCLGNLAMISSGQNSSLQNESFEVKKAHVESYINGSKGGTIESLKMLDIYETSTWNETEIKIHSDKMINVLINSFDKSKYSEIVENLSKHKFEIDDAK